MNQSKENFIKYYDKLFLNKDYSKETQYILKSLKIYSELKLKNILDLGCGTGSHTIEFFKQGYNIIGLDLDKQMINLAKNKTQKINFIYGNIKDYEFNTKFELIFSFFNVLNYIENYSEMIAFLTGVYKNLKAGGVFVFDGWNGNRIPLDPPIDKEIIINEYNLHAKGMLYPNYDAFNNQAKFHYIININDAGKHIKIEYYLPQTYWSPLILKQMLYQIGFSKVETFKNLTFEKASIDDYKISWICKK